MRIFFFAVFWNIPLQMQKKWHPKKWPFARQHKNDPKKMSIYLEKKKSYFWKISPLWRALRFYPSHYNRTRFYQKNIDEITILHRNFVCFSIFFRITICKPNLICQKWVKSDTKYHCKIIFFFFCKITIYKPNLGNKNVYC